MLVTLLFSCAPALNREYLTQGERILSFDQLRANPDAYKGKMYVLGGLIVETRFTEAGSQMEILSVPVDSRGYLEEGDGSRGRFLAVFPKSKGLLDPVIYKKGREVSLAGQFIDIRKGKIDDMEYIYPLFEVSQVHLFPEEQYYYYPYPYYYPYSYPYWSYPGPWPPPPGWWW